MKSAVLVEDEVERTAKYRLNLEYAVARIAQVFGNLEAMVLMSSEKPMSSMRSASSRMKKLTLLRSTPSARMPPPAPTLTSGTTG